MFASFNMLLVLLLWEEFTSDIEMACLFANHVLQITYVVYTIYTFDKSATVSAVFNSAI